VAAPSTDEPADHKAARLGAPLVAGQPGKNLLPGRRMKRDGKAPGSGMEQNPKGNTEMAKISQDIGSMDQLFVHALQDIYYAEKKIVSALPKMIEKVTSDELREGFETHLEETRGHVDRLERVFELCDEKPKTVQCPAIDGIIEEAEEVSGEVDDDRVMDAALAAAAQAVEHYEIARYGTLVAWAKTLGKDECAEILQETLEEEKATDAKLTKLAEKGLNKRAA
jgi:ferritin-like metal-binding protein YciE